MDVGGAEHAIHSDPVRMVARDQQVRLYGLLVVVRARVRVTGRVRGWG